MMSQESELLCDSALLRNVRRNRDHDERVILLVDWNGNVCNSGVSVRSLLKWILLSAGMSVWLWGDDSLGKLLSHQTGILHVLCSKSGYAFSPYAWAGSFGVPYKLYKKENNNL